MVNGDENESVGENNTQGKTTTDEHYHYDVVETSRSIFLVVNVIELSRGTSYDVKKMTTL